MKDHMNWACVSNGPQVAPACPTLFITFFMTAEHYRATTKCLICEKCITCFHQHIFLFVSSMATDSPVGTPPKCPLPPDVTMSTTPPQPRKPLDDDRSEGRPSPRQVTTEELNVLEVCLRRWREEVEGDVKGEWTWSYWPILRGSHTSWKILILCFKNASSFFGFSRQESPQRFSISIWSYHRHPPPSLQPLPCPPLPHKHKPSSSSFVSFTQCSPTCGRMPLPALSLWPGRQPCRPRLVDEAWGENLVLYLLDSLTVMTFRILSPFGLYWMDVY